MMDKLLGVATFLSLVEVIQFVFLILYFIYKPKTIAELVGENSSTMLSVTESISNDDTSTMLSVTESITNEENANNTNVKEEEDSSTSLKKAEETNNITENWEDDIT